MATAPPLGICALKGHIQKVLNHWEVTTLDLNLKVQEEALSAILMRGGLDRRLFPEGILAEVALTRAGEVFRGAYPHEFFHRSDRYSLYAEIWLRFYESLCNTNHELERICRTGSSIPQVIQQQADMILSLKPDLVGLSLCYSQQAWWTICLGKALKQLDSVPVVVGGTMFSEHGSCLLREYPDSCDWVISGEGEHALAMLLQNLENPSAVPGLTYRKAGTIFYNPPLYENDLNLLTLPDFSQLDLSRYFSPIPVLPILASRGCYWRRCAFCVHYRSAGLTYRTRSLHHIMAELREHCARGITHFAFVDEMISPNLFEQLADAIISAGLEIKYYALAKPVKQFTSPLLEKIYKSGCRYIMWGLESGSQRILDLMEKGTDLDDVSEVLTHAHRAGLKSHVYIMAGFPGESAEEFSQTLTFLENHKHLIYAVHRGIFHLMPGSPVFDHPERFGVQLGPAVGDWLSCGWHSFSCNMGMNQQEVRQAFTKSLPFLRSFNPFSGYLGNFRDHALLIYAYHNKNLSKAQPSLNQNQWKS